DGGGGRQPFFEPAQPEFRDRRQEDQHFGEHDEQDGEKQQLGRQAARQRHLLVGALLPVPVVLRRLHWCPRFSVCPSEKTHRDLMCLGNRILRHFYQSCEVEISAVPGLEPADVETQSRFLLKPCCGYKNLVCAGIRRLW